EFCAWLTKSEPGRVYRLPTEAEWEYACRAGTTTAYHFGPTITTDLANFNDSPLFGGGGIGLQQTTPARSYPPTAWGLYHMHGQVLEGCQGPPGPSEPSRGWFGVFRGSYQVNRGGSWSCIAEHCRSASCNVYKQAHRYNDLGFRVALVLSGE